MKQSKGTEVNIKVTRKGHLFCSGKRQLVIKVGDMERNGNGTHDIISPSGHLHSVEIPQPQLAC